MFKNSVIILIFLLCIKNSYGTSIFYEGANISGNLWEYRYSVNNNTLGVNINEFSVFFDPALYQNLATNLTPTGWDSLVLQPDLLIPDDGLYDALAIGIGITPNSTETGFSVRFNYLGAGFPSTQPFKIVDPVTFATIESGTTTLNNPILQTTRPIPTLSQWALFLLSMMMLIPFHSYSESKCVA